MSDLSPAAQAVLDAYWANPGGLVMALRAVADQVVPNQNQPKASCIDWKQCILTRAQLLAIAYELEKNNEM